MAPGRAASEAAACLLGADAPPRPRRGKGEAGGARGISGSSPVRVDHRSLPGAPGRPAPAPCPRVRAERSPGRPPPRALYFPGWNRRGLPGRAGGPPLPGGDRVQRGARPREQGRAEALEPPHLAVSARPLCSRGRGRGPRGALGRPRLLSAVVARSQQLTELTASSAPRFQTRTICVTPILNLRQTCIAWL